MANADPTNEDLNTYDFDSRSSTYHSNQLWNLTTMDQMDNMQHTHNPRRHVSPIQTTMATMRSNTLAEPSMMEDWSFQLQHLQQQQQQQQQQHQQQYQHQHPHYSHQTMDFGTNNALDMQYNPYQNISMPEQMLMNSMPQATVPTTLPIDQHFLHISQRDSSEMENAYWDFQIVRHTTQDAGMPPSPSYQQSTRSPLTPTTDAQLELISHGSGSDDAFVMVGNGLSPESQHSGPYYVVPADVLPERSFSQASSSDWSMQQFMPLDLLSGPAVCSPMSSDSDCEHNHYHSYPSGMDTSTMNSNVLARAVTIPPSSKGSSPDRSPGSQGSAGSPGRKQTTKKSPIAARPDRVQKKTSTNKAEASEKRVGRRKGPLKLEQRKQAGEIRKIGACLRCRFLKKTCDKGEPCAGCQPSHARLWQVPCTRIDIKEIGYFWKDKKFDYERHHSLGFSVLNVKGYGDRERIIHITHGYGHMLPVAARETYVRDEKCLKMDWIEANGSPDGYEVITAGLSAGCDGISMTQLSEYLDLHIDHENTFENFVDEYFEGTPFLSQMLKVAFRFYARTKSAIIKKALKLMLAYCLTVHITMVEGDPVEEAWIGKIDDETSKFYGKTIAPVMINFQIKCAMADMWRELHKDVLEELSSLYSSVYSGDKLKNWPTIFILASVLLAVWECMQFDCHYRVPDEAAVDKFCTEMEATPVGVVVGLFSAISQKLPSILEWDTSKHHTLLGSNRDVCDTMTEVRQHVTKYEGYLRERPNAKFDSKDFDSLSNKFLSRLVLRDIRVG